MSSDSFQKMVGVDGSGYLNGRVHHHSSVCEGFGCRPYNGPVAIGEMATDLIAEEIALVSSINSTDIDDDD